MQFENREDKEPLSTNLDGVTFPKLNLQEEIIRKFEPNLDDFLNKMDIYKEKTPEFIEAKLPYAFKILDEEILTYACKKLYESGLPYEFITILINILSNAEMRDLNNKPIQKIVLQELFMKINKLRLMATSYYIDFGEQVYNEGPEQPDLAEAMIAADRLFIKKDNGCPDTEEEKSEIINGFTKLLSTLEMETSESLKELEMVDPELYDQEFERRNHAMITIQMKINFYREVLIELESTDRYRLYDASEKTNLYGGEETKFNVNPKNIYERLGRVYPNIEEIIENTRSAISQ